MPFHIKGRPFFFIDHRVLEPKPIVLVLDFFIDSFDSFDFSVSFLDFMAPRKVAASKGGAKRGGGAMARGSGRGVASSSRASPAAVGEPADVPMIVGELLTLAG